MTIFCFPLAFSAVLILGCCFCSFWGGFVFAFQRMPEKWVTFFPNFQLNLPRCDLWPWLLVLCYDTTYPELGCQLLCRQKPVPGLCFARTSKPSTLSPSISILSSWPRVSQPPVDSPHCYWTGGAKKWAQCNQPHLSLSSFASLLCSIAAFFLAKLVHRGVWELLVPVQIRAKGGLRTSAFFSL